MIFVTIKNPCSLLFAEVAHVNTVKEATLNQSARYFIVNNLFLDKNPHQYWGLKSSQPKTYAKVKTGAI
ncbi:hypothetical protein BN59_01072 [Legionella massiliensis]|uniref:Uncharacterized protein n=1 Tax=Legionella massiliensis TaxID=1034943 RepID=A0A078KUS1_9GAMM|nr:hypothetical protein BN59_01072 [Legionella massiliensis]CEE12534.1 hypothetical protein BN1094_01072 [Legionella massiliensis]